MVDHIAQQRELDGGEILLTVAAQNAAVGKVEREGAEFAELRFRFFFISPVPVRPADDRFHAREQLGKADGLDHVIVAAASQRVHDDIAPLQTAHEDDGAVAVLAD